MIKARILVVSSAVLLAACSSSATISGSSAKSVGGSVVELDNGLNAASSSSESSDIPARINPVAGKASQSSHNPAVPAATARASMPSMLMPNDNSPAVRDRCMNESGHPGKNVPLPMCAPA